MSQIALIPRVYPDRSEQGYYAYSGEDGELSVFPNDGLGEGRIWVYSQATEAELASHTQPLRQDHLKTED